MNSAKGIFVRGLSLMLCITFLISCHSGNNVVSSYGKRKYRKGWFWFSRKSVDTKANKSKDSTYTRKHVESQKPEKKVSTEPPHPEKEEVKPEKHNHRAERDSLKKAAKARKQEAIKKNEQNKIKTKAPPDPPDHVLMRLLVLIAIITALSLLITGLMTPIIIWKVTQNFLIISGVVFTFFAYILSTNAKPEINDSEKGIDKPYNLGKPAWKLSVWALILMSLLVGTVKTSLIADLLLVNITTVGLFIAGACILLSLLFAIKALFVNDKHKGKAALALIIDIILITIGILLFI